jgi:hypothetical protein
MTNDASQWLLALERERDELGDLRYRYSALYSAVRFLLEEERKRTEASDWVSP